MVLSYTGILYLPLEKKRLKKSKQVKLSFSEIQENLKKSIEFVGNLIDFDF